MTNLNPMDTAPEETPVLVKDADGMWRVAEYRVWNFGHEKYDGRGNVVAPSYRPAWLFADCSDYYYNGEFQIYDPVGWLPLPDEPTPGARPRRV